MTKPKAEAPSLVEFARTKRMDARRAACAICALPDDIRAQMKEARDKKIDKRTVREWLKVAHGIEIADQVFVTHGGAHHDQRED